MSLIFVATVKNDSYSDINKTQEFKDDLPVGI